MSSTEAPQEEGRPTSLAAAAEVPSQHPDPANNENSTPYLQQRLQQLKTQSHELSTELTKRLATSRSGQSLLHIGPSLSTLPPDLSSLIDALTPLLGEVQNYESLNRSELERLVGEGQRVQTAIRKREFAIECAEIYSDLIGAEEVLRKDVERRDGGTAHARLDSGDGLFSEEDEGDLIRLHSSVQFFITLLILFALESPQRKKELDHATSLERAAYTTLHLLQELQSSSAEVSAVTSTPLKPTQDEGNNSNVLPSLNDATGASSGINGVIMEKSRFLMKLAPRIRRLESDTAKCLVATLESLLVQVRSAGESNVSVSAETQGNLLLMIGHCLRGLALLGKGSHAESAFARVAIMPIIRSRLSMGKLDEGGSRGECAGLFFLLDDIANTVKKMFGPVLRSGEGMFATHGGGMEVDLVTCGVWVPVATALIADPGIKMAIFSPGIANVLQANYSALDTFLSELANSLLSQSASTDREEEKVDREDMELGNFSHLYYRPEIDSEAIERAQRRLYAHSTTADYYKKWNLPIYYQLRFGEFCQRLDKALNRVQRDGWHADVFTGSDSDAKKIKESLGLELPVFFELYDTLLSMWKSTVYLRPLTHRFLRGAVQLVGRMLAFVRSGLNGEIEFGGTEEKKSEAEASAETAIDIPAYLWNERVDDIAVVAWELTILDTCMTHDYLQAITSTVCPSDEESRKATHNSASEIEEIRDIASSVLMESSTDMYPLVTHSWNKLIVENLTSQCSKPLSAVKGVAATYRMTNRPPPSQPSPFVASILRPLRDFDKTYASRTPPQVGDEWKQKVIEEVSSKYSVAVEELIATVKRTEEALKNRKTRRMMVGGMSDNEKVKLQLFLDQREFKSSVEDVGIKPESIAGIVKLGELTAEAASLFEQTQKK